MSIWGYEVPIWVLVIASANTDQRINLVCPDRVYVDRFKLSRFKIIHILIPRFGLLVSLRSISSHSAAVTLRPFQVFRSSPALGAIALPTYLRVIEGLPI